MQKNRKQTTEPSLRKKTQQKMEAYLQNQAKAEQQYCQTLEEYLCVNDVSTCFRALHLYLEKGMICEIKKNVLMEDGVYLLLQGNLTYVWTKNRHDRDHKDHLFLLAKSGGFSNLGDGSAERDGLLASGYSLMINNPFAVVQCEGGNLCTNEDSVFLKIPEHVLEATQFYKLKSQRIDTCKKAKFPGARINSLQPLLELNCNLHHTFKSKRLLFRNKIQVQTLGIITSGSAIVKKFKSCRKIELLKSCILLPNYQYEVSSSELDMIEIVKNPTIIFTKPYLISKFIDDLSVSLPCESINDQKNDVKKYCKRITNSISMHKLRTQKKDSLRKQEEKKKKEFSLFSKQNEEYWIVSVEVCKGNIETLRTYKKNLPKDAKEPKALFNVCKKQRLVQDLSDPGASLDGGLKNWARNTNIDRDGRSSGSNDLMERYSIYARDMFQKYRRHKGIDVCGI